jgi:hypothetical protein
MGCHLFDSARGTVVVTTSSTLACVVCMYAMNVMMIARNSGREKIIISQSFSTLWPLLLA